MSGQCSKPTMKTECFQWILEAQSQPTKHCYYANWEMHCNPTNGRRWKHQTCTLDCWLHWHRHVWFWPPTGLLKKTNAMMNNGSSGKLNYGKVLKYHRSGYISSPAFARTSLSHNTGYCFCMPLAYQCRQLLQLFVFDSTTIGFLYAPKPCASIFMMYVTYPLWKLY